MIIPFGFLRKAAGGAPPNLPSTYVLSELDIVSGRDAAGVQFPQLTKIDDTHFIECYNSSATNKQTVKIWAIEGGLLVEKDALVLDAFYGSRDSGVVLMDSTHFAVAWNGNTLDGWIGTISFNPTTYVMTAEHLFEHDIVFAEWNSLVKIDANHVALAYSGTGNDGFLKVFTFDGSWQITLETTLEHDPVLGNFNSFQQIDATHYALAYNGGAADGYLKVFSLDTGTWVFTQVGSTYTFTTTATYIHLRRITDLEWLVVVSWESQDGAAWVIEIDGSYAMTTISSKEWLTTNTIPSACVVDDNHYLIGYASTQEPSEQGRVAVMYLHPTTRAHSTLQTFIQGTGINGVHHDIIQLTPTKYVVASSQVLQYLDLA